MKMLPLHRFRVNYQLLCHLFYAKPNCLSSAASVTSTSRRTLASGPQQVLRAHAGSHTLCFAWSKVCEDGLISGSSGTSDEPDHSASCWRPYQVDGITVGIRDV